MHDCRVRHSSGSRGETIAGLRPIHGTSGIGNETAAFIVNWDHNPAGHNTLPRIEPDAESISKCRVDSALLQVRMFGLYRGQPERKLRVRPPDRIRSKGVHWPFVMYRVRPSLYQQPCGSQGARFHDTDEIKNVAADRTPAGGNARLRVTGPGILPAVCYEAHLR